MAKVHQSSIVEGPVQLADDVEVGPGCVIRGKVVVGTGTRLLGHVYLLGPLTIGRKNIFYPNSCIGFGPQHRQFDVAVEGMGTRIGDDNIFREGATVHRAFGDRPTVVGNQNYLMCNSHLGHDVVLGCNCTLANGVLLAGHVTVEDNVTLGGNAVVHQYCRLGRLSMMSGGIGIVQDLPPFCTVYEMRRVGSLNIVGLRRAGYRRHVAPLQEAFRILYQERHTRPRAMEIIMERVGEDPLCAELIHFVKGTRRGITGPGRLPADADVHER